MGLRSIPAQRLLAAHAATLGAVFTFPDVAFSADQAPVAVDGIVVFSPAMYLPAVISKAQALAKFVFGSADVLGIERSVNDMAVLGVEADVMTIDGSPQGVLRSLLLTRASEQLFELNTNHRADTQQVIDLGRVTAYYRSEGAPAIRGEQDDFLSVDPSGYEWRP